VKINKLLDKISENWIAKAVSIGIAVLLFVFHRMAGLETRFMNVPLAVQTGNALVPASSYPRVIRVSLRGDADKISAIQEDDIEAFIDLERHDSAGTYRAPVQIRKRGSALGIEPLEITVEPAEITLQLDRKTSKYIPLQANIRGDVDAGYEFVSHTLSPAQVMADGPYAALNAISLLSTDFIDLDGRNEDFSMMLSILNQDPLVVIRGNRMTEFRGYIRKTVAVRTIDGIPIGYRNLNEQFEVLVERTGSLRLESRRNNFDMFDIQTDGSRAAQMADLSGFLSVDCSDINAPGVYTLPVALNLPEGLVLIRQEPTELTVIISVKENT